MEIRVIQNGSGLRAQAPPCSGRLYRVNWAINLEAGTSVDSLADKLKRLAESGADEAFVDAFAVFPTLDQMLDFASQVIARTGRL